MRGRFPKRRLGISMQKFVYRFERTEEPEEAIL